MPVLHHMPIIPEIIEQHAEDAAFNWLLRDNAVSQPHYDLKDLARLDDRIEANVDGLRIAGDEGWEICRETMAAEEPGEIFTAGVIAYESKKPDRMDTMLAAVESEIELQRALVSALGWIDFDRVAEPARKLLGAELPFLRLIGLSTYAVHRQDPGPMLAKLISDEDPAVRARALKAVSELGRSDLLPFTLNQLTGGDERSRFYAAWSGTILGVASSVAALQTIAETESPYSDRACTLSVRKMVPRDATIRLEKIRQRPEKARQAIVGLGALGDPAAMPWLMDRMQVPELARPAGEAFTMITGVDLAYEDLDGEWPEGFEAGPTEDPEDENVEMDPDEDLPWPNPLLIQEWWHKNKSNFKSGVRYLCGETISEKQCQRVLRHGYQRQRAAAAIELSTMKPGRPLFNVCAPGFRQQILLGLK
jgi:uncharacterized protein (TIGR02270 family)